MADNYLENRYNEVFGSRKTVKKVGQGLDTLLLRNRSVRGYDHAVEPGAEVLRRIVGVNTKIPSARNQQALRFRIVTDPGEAAAVNANIKMGAALPELNLPFSGTEPQAFIVVCAAKTPDNMTYIDLGISLQSMLLKAVEVGFNGLIICAFNRENIRSQLNLPCNPLAVLAIGKSAETIRLVPADQADSLKYYRDAQNVHYVPKIQLEDLIIK